MHKLRVSEEMCPPDSTTLLGWLQHPHTAIRQVSFLGSHACAYYELTRPNVNSVLLPEELVHEWFNQFFVADEVEKTYFIECSACRCRGYPLSCGRCKQCAPRSKDAHELWTRMREHNIYILHGEHDDAYTVLPAHEIPTGLWQDDLDHLLYELALDDSIEIEIVSSSHLGEITIYRARPITSERKQE